MLRRSVFVLLLALLAVSHSSFALKLNPEKMKEMQQKGEELLEFYWVQADSGKCLTVAGDNKKAGTNVHIEECRQGESKQLWKWNDLRLKNHGDMCLDAGGDVKKAGTNAQIWDCNKAPNQQWTKDGNRLKNAGGKCLDVGGDLKKDGTNVQIWNCNKAPNQKWTFK